MKVSEVELEFDLQTVIDDELQKEIKELLLRRYKEIRACKRTLKKLKDNYKKLLDTDVEDLELDGFEY